MKIGFIGLGIMGTPMAINLLKAGYALTVHNRTPGKAAKLAAQNAKVASSPAAVAASSDFIITMLPDTPDVETVLFGRQGVVEALTPGKIIIDMSTISPQATKSFAGKLAALGGEMLDAPVSGGEPGAIAGTLTIMVGGREEVFEKCLPIFNALGKNVVYVGAHGSGQATKLVNQIICGLHLVAMAEGLQLAKLTGLDLERTLKVVSGGAAGSWMLSNLAPRILQGDFAPGFMIRLQQKDLRLAQELIASLGDELPGAALAYEMFSQAVEKGLGELGTQGLMKLRELSRLGESE